jgi:DNA primase
MIYDKDYYEKINNKIKVSEFYSEDTKTLYNIINNLYSKSEKIKIEDIRKEIELLGDEYKKIDKSIIDFEFQYEPNKIDDILDDLINTVIHSNLEKKRRKIIQDIEKIEKKLDKTAEDNVYFKNLCLELTKLNSEIKLVGNE